MGNMSRASGHVVGSPCAMGGRAAVSARETHCGQGVELELIKKDLRQRMLKMQVSAEWLVAAARQWLFQFFGRAKEAGTA